VHPAAPWRQYWRRLTPAGDAPNGRSYFVLGRPTSEQVIVIVIVIIIIVIVIPAVPEGIAEIDVVLVG
jgi:hypothetical protein